MGYESGTYDFYDDGGRILQKLVPDSEDLPDFVKLATQVSQDQHPNMFALVMVDDGNIIKRYPTPDQGNTWLSTLYFSETRHDLPEEAQKIAAANLIEACEAYDINTPEFLFDVAGGPAETNVVDVTDLSPPSQQVQAEDSATYAIDRGDEKRYRLDSPDAVKVASEYFEENYKRMRPRDRRDFAVKVASEAKKGAMKTPQVLKKYASEGYSPNVEAHLTTRYLHLTNAEAAPEVRERLVKMASHMKKVSPEDFAVELEAFDRAHGLDALWDKDLADPWYSTFCMEKVAEESENDLSRFAREAKDAVGEHFGAQFADAFANDPSTIYDSLPTPQKRVIERMASAYSSSSAQ